MLTLERLAPEFSVCRVATLAAVDFSAPFVFVAKTDRELSVVCPTAAIPATAAAREDGWAGFRVAGTLDFSLVGVLAGLTAALAARKVSVFAVSTFDTDYLLVKREALADAMAALRDAGYFVAE